jgi:DNA-binding response OmpR family regulator
MTLSAATDAHRPTVLVVDDDKVLREIIGTNLELGGFDVLSAPDGPSALALLDDRLPDTTEPVKSLEAGADDFITKPFSPQEMLARVRAKVRRANVDSSLQPLTRLPGNIVRFPLTGSFVAMDKRNR